MYCMTCGEEKELKSPAKAVSAAIDEATRDSGTFNYARTVGFSGGPCAAKGLATHIISSGGLGFHCSVCGEIIGTDCTCN